MSADRFLALPLSTEIDGRTWNLTAADFTNSDGKFSAYFYAISDEHAGHVLDDIKDNAVVRNLVGITTSED